MNKFIIKQAPRGVRESDTGKTLDSAMYKKDCRDFICLDDGTLVRECRYCNLSLICRQTDYKDGKWIPMEAHILPAVDPDTGEVIENQLFCTGMYDLRSLSERVEDDKVS
jgi:hypothetical protein